jgi:hypothetical protein
LIWENRDHCKKIEIMGGGGSSKGNKGRR